MIEQINTDFGRYYKNTETSVVYPSVTTVLASIPNPSLEAWKQAVGPEKAAKISKQASTTGTRLHTYCEDVLNGKKPVLDMFDKEMFRGIDEHLKFVKAAAIEKRMFSKKLRSAGTIDVFGKYKGTLAIIDFKTTGHEKYPGEYDNYWIQTSAYAAMIYELLHVPIPDLFLIFQDISCGRTYVEHARTKDWLGKYLEVREKFEDKSHLIQ